MTVATRLLAEAAAGSGLMAANLSRHADDPVSTVLDGLTAGAGGPGRPVPEDLLDVVARQAEAYHGPWAAAAAVAALRIDPVVSTSNHLGVDTLAVSAQCTLLTALRRGTVDGPPTLVVLGCGTVGLDSGSYPMGLLLYDDPGRSGGRRAPHRLPVLPNRVRRHLTAVAASFDEAMVAGARKRLNGLVRDGTVSAFCGAAASTVLDRDFADPDVLSRPAYRHQAVAVNTRLWARAAPGVRIVQLCLEEVATALLARDLSDPDSLAHRVILDERTRSSILADLDGVRACWDLAGLRAESRNPASGSPPRHGTVLFWGVGPDARRIALRPRAGTAGLVLHGVDRHGETREWACDADTLGAALHAGELIPSLFTCFTVLVFARGLGCVGGPYQAHYLPLMQEAVDRAVRPDDEAEARRVSGTPAGLCVADMHLAMRMTGDGRGVPAGPLEIAAAGGLGADELARVPATLTVREAYQAALPELLPETVPDELLAELTRENPRSCPNVLRLGA